MPAAKTATETPRVYVVIATWNNHDDAIECLDALVRSDYPNFAVVLCDNASADGTLDRIRRWAEAPTPYRRPAGSPLGAAAEPLAPVPLVVHDRAAAERGGGADDAGARLVLVQTGANLGYAGGNNVGLRYALARGDADYLWLLNGDTVVAADGIARLVAFAGAHPEAGLIGAPLLDYDDPSLLQAYGGASWDAARAEAHRLGEGAPADARPPVDQLDLLVGVSMFATRAWVETVGLLEERYFLYCEEVDWATRGRGRFALAVAPEARVFHKMHTAGKSGWTWRRWYYFQRARLLFTARFYPRHLATVGALVAKALARRLVVIATHYAATTVKRALPGMRPQ